LWCPDRALRVKQSVQDEISRSQSCFPTTSEMVSCWAPPWYSECSSYLLAWNALAQRRNKVAL
jgi:hypothetical protein